MFSQTKTLTLLTLLFTTSTLANTFAQFCNDDNCSEGCGTAVDVNNPGCLTQFGRRSVMFHNANFGDVSMVASPGSTCDCQNYCETDILQLDLDFHPDNGCFKLRDEEAQSFRFIQGDCPADQC